MRAMVASMRAVAVFVAAVVASVRAVVALMRAVVTFAEVVGFVLMKAVRNSIELKIHSVAFDPSAYKKSYNFVSRIKGV